VEERVGAERARGAYAWASLARAGATLALGSDFPVEPENPFYGLHAAATRQDRSNAPSGGWRPEERLTMEAALRGFTLGAAFAEGTADRRGSIAVGKDADFIVIDRDVMTTAPERIPGTRVLATVIAGEVVFADGDGPLRE